MQVKPLDADDFDAVLPRVRADDMGIDPEVGEWVGAYDDDGELLGVARITEAGDGRTIDDVWVFPEQRRRGVAGALIAHAGPPLWLICDDDMIGFYQRRGFALAEPADFPAALAALYGARGEWPRASDHVHHAMVLR